jgi:hypothetical protein
VLLLAGLGAALTPCSGQAIVDTVSQYLLPLPGTYEEHVDVREVPTAAIDSLRRDPDFWYANRRFVPEQQKHITLPKPWLNLNIYAVLVVMFVAALAWYLVQANFTRRRSIDRAFRSGRTDGSEDIFTIDYDKEIDAARARDDFRLAIRFLFLKALMLLSRNGVIQYQPERTNLDYLAQLRPNRLYQPFFRVARDYEYAWYGQFEVSPANFDIIRKDFEKLYVELQ